MTGLIVIKFNDFKPGSKYLDLVNTMKTSGVYAKVQQLYANFYLNLKRSNMLSHIHKAHKEDTLGMIFCL